MSCKFGCPDHVRTRGRSACYPFRPCDPFHASARAVCTIVGVDDVEAGASVFFKCGNRGHVPTEGGRFLVVAWVDESKGLSFERDTTVALVDVERFAVFQRHDGLDCAHAASCVLFSLALESILVNINEDCLGG